MILHKNPDRGPQRPTDFYVQIVVLPPSIVDADGPYGSLRSQMPDQLAGEIVPLNTAGLITAGFTSTGFLIAR